MPIVSEKFEGIIYGLAVTHAGYVEIVAQDGILLSVLAKENVTFLSTTPDGMILIVTRDNEEVQEVVGTQTQLIRQLR